MFNWSKLNVARHSRYSSPPFHSIQPENRIHLKNVHSITVNQDRLFHLALGLIRSTQKIPFCANVSVWICFSRQSKNTTGNFDLLHSWSYRFYCACFVAVWPAESRLFRIIPFDWNRNGWIEYLITLWNPHRPQPVLCWLNIELGQIDDCASHIFITIHS